MEPISNGTRQNSTIVIEIRIRKSVWFSGDSQGVEIELLKWSGQGRRIAAEIQFTPKTSDHPGIKSQLTFFSWEFSVHFYDNRHADAINAE
jgi:hypothetical protein